MELRLPTDVRRGAGLVAQPPNVCRVEPGLPQPEGYVDPYWPGGLDQEPADAAVMAACMSFSAWSTLLSPLMAA